jgi:hypothetical protein
MLDKLFGFRRSGLLPHRLFPDTILAKIANRSLPDGEFWPQTMHFLLSSVTKNLRFPGSLIT